jgi:predicted glycoside hydrolase/deacetylase ChbG (UPF0249 family)
MKRIVLCADDYGQGLAISRGILDLVERGRLSAVSCLVTGADWPQHAAWLAPFHGKIDIGLHVNLTEGKPLSAAYQAAHGSHFLSLTTLLRKTFLRQINRQAIVAECHAQLDRFERVMGRLPDFIDGHQHVHQFPVIRDALIEVYAVRLKGRQPYVRLVNHRTGLANIKKMIIYLSGTRMLGKLLRQHQIPHNTSFSGIYSFKLAKNYPHYFQSFITEIGDRGIIMCHPGRQSDLGEDEIAEERYLEYRYFGSDQFLQDCRRNGVELVGLRA